MIEAAVRFVEGDVQFLFTSSLHLSCEVTVLWLLRDTPVVSEAEKERP